MKHILMIATGGTIASLPQEDGLAPALSGEDLASRVPLIDGLCDLDVIQPMNIDSTNMRPRDWLRIAREIRDAYDSYDGFVILHGTDTMAYTAAALSYLVQGSPKPIVLTGAQQPMANPFTDAKLNLYHSLLFALDDHARDVSIVFGGKAICGTRARKLRTMSFNAFGSVNYPTLAYLRADRVVWSVAQEASMHEERRHPEDASGQRPRFSDVLDERVIVLKLTPELKPSIFSLIERDYDAVILETFGIGGIPGYKDGTGSSFEKAIFDWVDSGRTVVLTTQVPEEGIDLGIYEVGRPYADKPGVLKGADMTSEALVAKTMWALGQTRDQDELQELFERPVNHDRLD